MYRITIDCKSYDLQSYILSNTSRKYVPDAYDGRNITFAYSQDELAYADFTWLAAWNGAELRAVQKTIFEKMIQTASFSVTLSNWSNQSNTTYYLNIHTLLAAQNITDANIIRIDLTNYSGNWRIFSFDLYQNNMYIFSNIGSDTSGTMRVMYRG